MKNSISDFSILRAFHISLAIFPRHPVSSKSPGILPWQAGVNVTLMVLSEAFRQSQLVVAFTVIIEEASWAVFHFLWELLLRLLLSSLVLWRPWNRFWKGWHLLWLGSDWLVVATFRNLDTVPWYLRNCWLNCISLTHSMQFVVSHIYWEDNCCVVLID